MTTIAWPTLTRKHSSCEWQLITKTLDTVSPFDMSGQEQEYVGARWGAVIEYLLVTDADVQAMIAFLAKLRGSANRTNLYHLDRPRSKGAWTGTPLVKGAGQTGTSILTDGWGTGSTVKAGDMVGIGTQLHVIVANAAEAGGEITLTVEPPRRAAPADNAAVTLTQPTCVMRRTEDIVRLQQIQTSNNLQPHRFTLQFVEVFE